MAFGTDPENAVAVLKAVKAVSTKPVYVKCTPQAPDLTYMCQALEQAGADGLVLLNTYLGLRLDYRTGKPILSNTTGGVSGPGIFPLVLQKIYQIYPKVQIPIIGCGGVSTARDVIEMMSAGAAAVEIGTAGLIDPMSVPKILQDLPGCLTIGETIEDVIRNAEDAKREWISAAIEDGIDIAEPVNLDEYSGQFKLRIPKSLHRKLAERSREEGVSMNQYCVYLLSQNR